ncbi:hypothetical protein BS78_04G006200 [Paspalum vaginatum]|nr:hypothetical protein BS78_04G006200 [Paspalum vaginatum]
MPEAGVRIGRPVRMVGRLNGAPSPPRASLLHMLLAAPFPPVDTPFPASITILISKDSIVLVYGPLAAHATECNFVNLIDKLENISRPGGHGPDRNSEIQASLRTSGISRED